MPSWTLQREAANGLRSPIRSAERVVIDEDDVDTKVTKLARGGDLVAEVFVGASRMKWVGREEARDHVALIESSNGMTNKRLVSHSYWAVGCAA